ncbi:MarR family winged helix-turn-helix transcriptional regulator [Massilia horti]|uniref:MarR family transcriptional regulator n=1 Tax=Massilia horti TaxID=2562153 RepID=A0A4Y9SWX8_9BURK|nr:MarR family transcriptional regulator [Massilia horti]TFW31117.1 MarR family transcriptional regulator [Massilia horti]
MDSLDHTLMNLTATLALASRSYKAAVDKVAADYGLSQATGLPVLIIGRLGNGVRPGVLADALGLEASSLVRVVDHLIEAGLLERREDPQDRRAKILELTGEGKKTAELMEQALIPFRRKLFEGFATADVEATLSVLSGLNALLAKPADPSAGRKPA